MYVQIGSSVIICYVRVRETLAAANRLQRYNKKLKYTKEFMFLSIFLLSRTQITYFRNILLSSWSGYKSFLMPFTRTTYWLLIHPVLSKITASSKAFLFT